MVSLCKSKNALIYTWVAKPFILPLHNFDKLKKYIRNRKGAARIGASEGTWGIPSSPIVGHLYVNFSYVVVVVVVVVVVKSGAERKQRGGGRKEEEGGRRKEKGGRKKEQYERTFF